MILIPFPSSKCHSVSIHHILLNLLCFPLTIFSGGSVSCSSCFYRTAYSSLLGICVKRSRLILFELLQQIGSHVCFEMSHMICAGFKADVSYAKLQTCDYLCVCVFVNEGMHLCMLKYHIQCGPTANPPQ